MYDLDGDWRQCDFLFARGLATGILLDVGHGKERTPRVRPAGCLLNRSGTTPSQIQLVIPVIGVRLQDTDVSGQVGLGMFALAVARVIEHRRRRPRSTKRPIVPHVNPASPGVGPAVAGRTSQTRSWPAGLDQPSLLQ